MLLALAAACGSGRPASSALSSTFDTEHGLPATSLCFGVDTIFGPKASSASCGDFQNGLPANLLSLKGLKTGIGNDGQFKKWFGADPAAADTLMKYLARCSLPANETLSYNYAGVDYSWDGGLGLAPTWTSGQQIPESEQQLVSACLAASANAFGVHVDIAILGQYANGTPIAVGSDELSQFPLTEGCFFGNLFQGDGVFSGNDRPMGASGAENSLRVCSLPDSAGGSNCAPIQYSGDCRDLCKADANNLYFPTCSVNGKSYRALTTRIQ
jgi:hypothetical protein